MKRRKWVALLIGCVGIVGLSLILMGLIQPAASAGPASAIYIEKSWLTKNATADNVTAIMARYHNPSELWLNGPGFRANGTFDTRDYGNLTAAIHEHSPGTKVIMIINVLTAETSPDRLITWNDPTTREALKALIVADAKQQGWDGVALDIEPMWNGNATYPAFIADLKASLPGVRIGLYGFRISNKPSHYRWNDSYYAQVANTSDFIMHSLYNVVWDMNQEGFGASPAGYTRYVEDKVNRTHTLGLTNVYWGLPAYPGTGGHDANVETIHNAAPALYNESTFVFYGMMMTNQDLRDYYAFREAQQRGN